MKKKLIFITILLVLAVLVLAACTPADDGEPAGLGNMWIFIALVPLMLLMVVPQMIRGRKQRKEQADRMSKIARGDKVLLIDGIYGVIDAVDMPNNNVIVNIGCGDNPLFVKLNLAGIHRIIEPEEEKAAEERAKQAEKEKEKEPEKVPMSADDVEADRRRKEKQAAKEAKRNASASEIAKAQTQAETDNTQDGTQDPDNESTDSEE